MVEIGGLSDTSNYLQTLASDCLGDVAPIRKLWNLAVAGRPRIEFAEGHTAWTKRTIGIGFDRRVRQLFALEPLPDQIPSRPPWARFDILGSPLGFGPDDPPTPENKNDWRRTSIQGTSRCPIPVPIFDELDRLTQLAMTNLVRPFAHLPLERRRPLAIIEGGGRNGARPLMLPDLILGSTLVDIKLSASGSFERRWAVQLARYLILDVDDHWGFTAVAIYEGRTGSLVTRAISDLIDGGMATLQEARVALRAFESLFER